MLKRVLANRYPPFTRPIRGGQWRCADECRCRLGWSQVQQVIRQFHQAIASHGLTDYRSGLPVGTAGIFEMDFSVVAVYPYRSIKEFHNDVLPRNNLIKCFCKLLGAENDCSWRCEDDVTVFAHAALPEIVVCQIHDLLRCPAAFDRSGRLCKYRIAPFEPLQEPP